MNKKIIFLVVLIISILYSKTSFSQNTLYTLEIQLMKLKSCTGKVLLQMYDEKDELVFSGTGAIDNNRCSFSISNLKHGKYSIRYFHDENGNDKLDTNWLGIPSEGYGFSNNASSMFGIPPIKDRLFVVNSNNTIILNIKY
jgi:uncharacterized protein (DUF2141 family)